MKSLPEQLEIKAGIMEMGEKIAWGSDTALMYQAAEKIKSLEAENAALRKQIPRWIPVSERLPERGKEVLVHYHSDGIGINELTDCWAYDDDLTVTRWMPLPPPPEQEQSE